MQEQVAMQQREAEALTQSQWIAEQRRHIERQKEQKRQQDEMEARIKRQKEQKRQQAR